MREYDTGQKKFDITSLKKLIVLLIIILYTYMWLVSFLIASITMGVYKGKLNDINGVPEHILQIFGKVIIIDRNILGIIAFTIVTSFATYLILF